MKKYLIKLDSYLGLLDARVIQFDQLNSSTCKLEFELTSNREVLDLTGKRATITIKCPSGAVIEDSILITNSLTGKLECILANDMISEVGMHYGELCIYGVGDTELFTSANFRYSISSQLGEDGVKVDTRYSTLQQLIFDVTELKDKSVIDISRVEELLMETTSVNNESKAINTETDRVNTVAQGIKEEANTIKITVEGIQSDITFKSEQVNANATRTEANANQVSTDKGVVTRYKNEVATNTETVASNKAIVEGYKADTLQYKSDAELAKTQSQQIKTDIEGLSNSTITSIRNEGTTQTNRVATEGTKQINLAKAEVTKATTQANIATQKAQEISSSAEQINRNKQELVDSIPSGSKSGQLFFVRKG